jgi:hypothetical protein
MRKKKKSKIMTRTLNVHCRPISDQRGMSEEPLGSESCLVDNYLDNISPYLASTWNATEEKKIQAAIPVPL